ncbi:substrate-binding domain-containing protein [Sphingobacterium spiritivorum]|uniref:substrate-binding domain-containing protein n=1 Tax=Sphingobacterium TaxID=28453 RepID=UPI001918BBF8|nr:MULTISPECIES: substrate-binding domain-containing protein [Sphingobacterium]QQT25373.1 substrate-binding domain-containing protein [Sphingobacterium spiritivorum]
MKLKLIVWIFSVVFFASCQNRDKTIKMKGSDTEVNLAVMLAERYSEKDKDFHIAISGGGSGLGIASLMNRQADIANSSRPLTEEEEELFRSKKIVLRTLTFAEDATAFVVHKDFPVDEIDLATLAKIMSGEMKDWKELTGESLPINIYGRQSSSGTYSFIKKKLKISFSPNAKEMTGNAQIIEGIKVDRSGIGYVGAGYISQESDAAQPVKILKIKKTLHEPAVSPLDKEAINTRQYYFQRPLYQFVLEESWEKVKPFIDFEKSGDGQAIIRSSGYYIIE